MAVTSPPRSAGTSSPGYSSRHSNSQNQPGGQLRVHWDRVAILAAILVLILVLIMVLVVRAFTSEGPEDKAVVATGPIEAADPAATQHTPAAGANPTVPETSSVPSAEMSSVPTAAVKPCPTPSAKPVYAAPRVAGGDASMPTVALTFDDGPGEFTPRVLDILREKQVRATFFVVGQMVAERPETVKAMVDAGHMVGNHTWSHSTPPSSVGWKAAALGKEIARTGRQIVSATGQEACIFRPPGGVIKGAGKSSRIAKLSMIIWSVDTRDWSGQAPRNRKFADKIRKRARAGLQEEHPIVLMHDGGGFRGSTVAALPGIIDDYRTAGYQFVDLAGNTSPM